MAQSDMNQTSQISADARITIYNTKLRLFSQIRDIWANLDGLYNMENQEAPPNAAIMTVQDSALRQKLTLKYPLREGAIYGMEEAYGTEEEAETITTEVYQDNYRKVIPIPGYGSRKLEGMPYDLWDQHKKDFGTWGKEEQGFQIRKAFLESSSENLTDPQADSSIDARDNFNMNTWVPGVTYNNQPEYDTDKTTFTQNIATVLEANGGLGQSEDRILSANLLEDISNMTVDSQLNPLSLPQVEGGSGFVVTLSRKQASLISNPDAARNLLGGIFMDLRMENDKFAKGRQNWYNVLGVYHNLLLCVDDRQPAIDINGASDYSFASVSPYSFVPQYVKHGSEDYRDYSDQNIKDTAFIVGYGALAKPEGEKEHWIDDERDYGFHKGIGVAGCRGYNLMEYHKDNASGTDDVNISSAVMLLDLPNAGLVNTVG